MDQIALTELRRQIAGGGEVSDDSAREWFEQHAEALRHLGLAANSALEQAQGVRQTIGPVLAWRQFVSDVTRHADVFALIMLSPKLREMTLGRRGLIGDDIPNAVDVFEAIRTVTTPTP